MHRRARPVRRRRNTRGRDKDVISGHGRAGIGALESTAGAFWISIRIAIVTLGVAALGPTEFLETLPESDDKGLCLCIFTERDQHADATVAEPSRLPAQAVDRFDFPPSGIRTQCSRPRLTRFLSGLVGIRPDVWPSLQAMCC